MNLNELFFSKVFTWYKNSRNELNLNIHDENNCYFYHTYSSFNQDGTEKIVEKDRRREPISFSKLFKSLLQKLNDSQDYLLSLDTIFELKQAGLISLDILGNVTLNDNLIIHMENKLKDSAIDIVSFLAQFIP